MAIPIVKTPAKPMRLPRRQRGHDDEARAGADQPEEEEKVEIMLSYSAGEALRSKDFGTFTWEEVQACKALLRELTWRIEPRKTRRKRPTARGRQIDMRRMLRRNLRYGGELLELTWRAQRTRQRPLVVLCDISGSMDRYSRILLQFVHTISNGLRDVEAFVRGGAADQRRLGPRRAQAAWPRDGATSALVPPSDLAEPTARQPRLPAADPGHAGRAAVCRRFPAGA
jgi:uncharacterized protein with von Willebrand factor type A (vWA) domain